MNDNRLEVFNSIQETLIIPQGQGAISLWLWRARKIIHKVKRTLQQTQHHQQKSLTLTIVIDINIEQLCLVIRYYKGLVIRYY